MKVEMTLPTQRDFPNCGKYKRCCGDDGIYNAVMKDVMKKTETNHPEMPAGFEGW